jgi:hypothetical protein
MWGAILSDPLGVVGLVGRYPTNYLIPREPLPARRFRGGFPHQPIRPVNACGIRPGFPGLSPAQGQVAHVLRTRSPLP